MAVDFKFETEKNVEFSKFLKSKNEELNSIYNSLFDLCNKIEENYKSQDSSVFLDGFRTEIESMVSENEDLNESGAVLDKTRALYTGQEEKWEKKVKQFDDKKEVIL